MPAVTTQGLVKRFRGGVVAVDGVNLTVEPGEILALVGASGCGKSTLLRLVAGLETPTDGRVSLFDRPVADRTHSVPPEARGVGMVFQEHALFPHLRVAANVAFGLRDLPASERAQRVEESLQRVGLPQLGGRYIHELSGGQRQRVALARALAPEPRLLLLDEPMSSLDERLRGTLRDDIASLLRARQTTAIWVTHRAEDALAVADRAAVLEAGRLVQLGRADELYRRPASAYVARLFGEVSQLESATAALLAPDLEGASAAHYLVRPESLRLASDGAPGTVAHCRYRGGGWRVEVSLDDGSRVLVDCGAAPVTGTRVHVRASADDLHLV